MGNLRINTKIPMLFLMALAFLSAGCLRENYSGCSEGVIVKFSYITGTGLPITTEIPETDRLSLFVFNENGLFITEIKDSSIQITNDYQMKLPFYDGQYQFVAWAGLEECYQLTHLIPGQTYLRDFSLQLKRETDKNISHSPSPLYYGNYPTISATPSETVTITIGLQQITNQIQVIVHNNNPDIQPEIRIEDNNGNYNYKGEIIPDDNLVYLPPDLQYTEETASWIANFSLMRLQSNSEARLIIKNGPDIPEYNEKLVSSLLEANPHINFDLDHHFTIEITFNDFSNIPVHILINGWEIINEEVD